jgi:hypothetical protein
MTPSCAIRRLSRAWLAACAALVGGALVASACGSPTAPASGSGALSSAPGSVPSGSLAQPSASVAAPSATPGPTISIADPDLAMTLPPGWEEQPVSTYRDRIDTQSKQNTGTVRAAMEELVRDADAGKLRTIAVGLTDYRAAYGTIIIQVNEGDKSLEAAVSRIEKRHDFVPHSDFEERNVDLAVGTAVRMSAVFPLRANPPPGAIPSHTVDYVVRLKDGRTLWLQATAPEAAKAFDAVIDAMVQTLRTR